MAASTPNQLTNSYFFYGTHPVKVNHSHSSKTLSSTHHLSLHNGLSTTSESATTRSLDDLRAPCVEEDETSEVKTDNDVQ